MAILSRRRFFSAAIRASLRFNDRLPCARLCWQGANCGPRTCAHSKLFQMSPSILPERASQPGIHFPIAALFNQTASPLRIRSAKSKLLFMKNRATWVAGAVALGVCLLCPLVDLFDQWDRALQTGSDSEYPLVVLALCVGLAFFLARTTAHICSNVLFSSIRFTLQSVLNSSSDWNAGAVSASTPGSPPLSLRI